MEYYELLRQLVSMKYNSCHSFKFVVRKRTMQYETKILTTKYQKPDAYGALSMPVYYTAARRMPVSPTPR